jgi:hypothetical protein
MDACFTVSRDGLGDFISDQRFGKVFHSLQYAGVSDTPDSAEAFFRSRSTFSAG